MNKESIRKAKALSDAVDWLPIHIPTNQSIVVGHAADANVIIKHPSISALHLRLAIVNGRVVIEALSNRYGTILNGVRLRRNATTPLKAGDLVRFGSSPSFRFDGQKLSPLPGTGPIGLTVDRLAVRRGGRELLGDITFSIQPGSFVGIIGPSGSGKSLILGCLASTVKPSLGTICYDGIPLENGLDEFRSKTGVVTQDDLVYEALTVTENFSMAARMRRPSLGRAKRRELVDRALELVEMSEHRQKLVRVLSGGQRKRVSIGIELLLRPRLLLLDEPTSGLDPSMEARVIRILRNLTRQGITVVCSTHTMGLIGYFDKVAVIGLQSGVGHLEFCGTPNELLPRFGVQTFPDLFDTLREVTDKLGLQGPGSDPIQEPIGHDSQPKHRRTSGTDLIRPKPRVKPFTLVGQTMIVAQRSMLGMWRDRTSSMFTCLQPLALAALVVISQHKQSDSCYIHFFVIVSSIWLGMTLAVREIVRERKLYVRDRLVCLSADAYLFGKLLFVVLITGIQSFVLFGFTHFMVTHVPMNSIARDAILQNNFAHGEAVVFLAGLGGAVLGLTVSSLASSERAAVAVLPLMILPQMLLSRVAYGLEHIQQNETPPSPFVAIADAGEFLNAPEPNVLDPVVFFASLPMMTRPASASLDMPVHCLPRFKLVSERIYLACLFLVHLLVLYVVFKKVELQWQQQHR